MIALLEAEERGGSKSCVNLWKFESPVIEAHKDIDYGNTEVRNVSNIES